jgi:glycosyltransferase involved in cell wall biosynthesis
MNKPKILFIGHGYHQKTLSNSFLLDILKESFDVKIYYDETWQNGPQVNKEIFFKEEYHCIIFYQIAPYRITLTNEKIKKVIFIVMYDGLDFKGIIKNFHTFFNKIIFINFSKTIHFQLINLGLQTYYFQYFPTPQEKCLGDKNKLFFWQRRNDINLNLVEKLFANYPINIHLHQALDPHQLIEKPSEEHIKKFQLASSDWFNSKEEFLSAIKDKTFFIAPRIKEGIGMSFLEAMAMGKIVIANNDATMNEYIEHGVNGYLFDYKNPKPLIFDNLDKIQDNAYEAVEQGYKQFQISKHNIIKIINNQMPPISFTITHRIYCKILRTIILIYYKFKKISINLICILIVNKNLKNKIRGRKNKN